MKFLLTDPFACFDLETTGVDVEADRVVTGAAGRVTPGQPWTVDMTTWLADPGVDIPTGASDVHGVTTAKAQVPIQQRQIVSAVHDDDRQPVVDRLTQPGRTCTGLVGGGWKRWPAGAVRLHPTVAAGCRLVSGRPAQETGRVVCRPAGVEPGVPRQEGHRAETRRL